MKCGKSTFLNSFVFEDKILPAAITPMTAALTVITYGDTAKIVAEFYSKKEWAEQEMLAATASGAFDPRSPEGLKITAARELVQNSERLGASRDQLLGKTHEDSLENLIEYVGASGKYVSITKSVTIYYPKDYLKGVEIVDTPGFNDPIVSREERTKEFLKNADVVLVMLYAGRSFDVIDKEIIFKYVRQCGIGKVLIAINKYDVEYCAESKPQGLEQIKEYVINEIQKASQECDDDSLIDVLKETEPIILSAEMALLSQLPMDIISRDDNLTFAWNRYCRLFGITTQPEMRHWSRISDLTGEITEKVLKEKDAIIFSKSINAIMAAGAEVSSTTDKEINLTQNEIELLQLPDDEIEDRKRSLGKARVKMDRKISTLEGDIEYEMGSIIRRGRNTLEDDVDSACNRMKMIVNNEWHRFNNFQFEVYPKIYDELQRLQTRTLKRSVESIADSAKHAIDCCISEFFADAEDILMRYLPDFDSRNFIKDVQRKIDVEVTDDNLFKMPTDDENEDYGIFDFIGDFFGAIIDGFTLGTFERLRSALCYKENKAEVLRLITSISSEFDPSEYLNAIMSSKDRIIATVISEFLTGLIDPLVNQTTEIESQLQNKEERLIKAQERLKNLEIAKDQIKSQLAEIEALRESFTR